jgi:DNA-binding response OmpR family regulator
VRRILVIDDDPQIRMLLEEALSHAGYDSIAVADGAQGVKLLLGDPTVRLVITDILMPEKDGLAVIRDIRDRFPGVQVIAMSGGGVQGLDFLKAATLMGARRAFRKPFKLAELLDAVRELIGSGEVVLA